MAFLKKLSVDAISALCRYENSWGMGRSEHSFLLIRKLTRYRESLQKPSAGNPRMDSKSKESCVFLLITSKASGFLCWSSSHGGPTGVALEGFPVSRTYPDQLFLQEGFAVLAPNFRGSSNYGGE